MTSATPLSVQDLTCCYGDQLVLDALSFALNAGEILGISGAKGAGMSTLIKALLLLVAPKSGRVLVFSKPHELPSSRSLLAYLPEEITTPGHLTGHDVINMTRTIHGEVKARNSIDELASDLDLPPERLIHPTGDYTKEDHQKLGLVALLSTERPILLLDQPMAHIGPSARAGLINHLRQYASKGGAVLLGSHQANDHQEISDRLVTLKDSRLISSAKPDGSRRSQAIHPSRGMSTTFNSPTAAN